MSTYMTNSTNQPLVINCTCETVDATGFDGTQRTLVQVSDPQCPSHGQEIPEVQCCRCQNYTPLKTSSWEEHDPKNSGWWCKLCRVDIGMDIADPPRFVTLHPRGHGKSATLHALMTFKDLLGKPISKEKLYEQLGIDMPPTPAEE